MIRTVRPVRLDPVLMEIGKQFDRAHLREVLSLAQHAQGLRAENQAMGYKSETAGFYGSDRVSPAEHSEKRLTAAMADAEARRAHASDVESHRMHVPMSASERLATLDTMQKNGW